MYFCPSLCLVDIRVCQFSRKSMHFFLMSGKYNRLCMTLVFLLGWGDEVMFFFFYLIE